MNKIWNIITLFFVLSAISVQVAQARNFLNKPLQIQYIMIDANNIDPEAKFIDFSAVLNFSDDTKFCEIKSDSGNTYKCGIRSIYSAYDQLTLSLSTLKNILKNEGSHCKASQQACQILNKKTRWSFLPEVKFIFTLDSRKNVPRSFTSNAITYRTTNSQYLIVNILDKNAK